MAEEPPSRAKAAPHPTATDRGESLDALFRTHCAALVRLAMVLLGDRQEAEEVVQDAFVSLHRNWAGLRDRSAAGAYLRAAVIRGCRSRQRRLVRARRTAPKLVVVSTVTVEDVAIGRDEASRVAAAVRALPTRQREVLVARYYLGLTEAQTAALLEVGLGSVKRHAHRALGGPAARDGGHLMSLDERGVAESLTHYAQGVAMTTSDIERMERDLHQRLGRRNRPRRTRLVLAAAAVLLLVAAVAGGVLWLRRPSPAVPATPQPVGSLSGVWKFTNALTTSLFVIRGDHTAREYPNAAALVEHVPGDPARVTYDGTQIVVDGTNAQGQACQGRQAVVRQSDGFVSQGPQTNQGPGCDSTTDSSRP